MTQDQVATARRWAPSIPVLIIVGCAISALNGGPRSTMGFFLTPMTSENGWGREVFALAGTRRAGRGLAAHGGREDRDQQHQTCHEHKRGVPAVGGDEPLAERREDELPDRSRRSADAEADGAHARRQQAGEG